MENVESTEPSSPKLVLAIHEALTLLAAEDAQLAELVKLRCFAGLSLTDVADALGISQSTAYEWWAYAKSRLRILLKDDAP